MSKADAIKFLDEGGKFAIFDATNSDRWGAETNSVADGIICTWVVIQRSA